MCKDNPHTLQAEFHFAEFHKYVVTIHSGQLETFFCSNLSHLALKKIFLSIYSFIHKNKTFIHLLIDAESFVEFTVPVHGSEQCISKIKLHLYHWSK